MHVQHMSNVTSSSRVPPPPLMLTRLEAGPGARCGGHVHIMRPVEVRDMGAGRSCS